MDSIFTRYLKRLVKPERRLFQGTPLWNDVMLIVRDNDRRCSQVAHERPDAGRSEEAYLEGVFAEVMVCFQDHLSGDVQPLSVHATEAPDVEETLAAGTESVTVALTPGQTASLALPERTISPAAFVIENSGSRPLVGVSVVVNDQRYGDLESILHTLIGPESELADLSERDLALSLVIAFRDAVRHGPRQVHRRRDPIAGNPVALFSYFGQATCGILAVNFCVLCASLGLKVRLRRSAAHTYPEIFFEDAWHIVDPDPDASPFYPDPEDSRRLLATEGLWEADRFAFERVHAPGLDPESRLRRSAALRSQERAGVVAEGESLLDAFRKQRPLESRLRLMPGETITLGYRKGGPWYCPTVPLTPPPKERSVMVREFDLVASGDLDVCEAHGIDLVGDGPSRAWAARQDRSGSLRIPLDGAFPILDATVTIDARCPPDERVQIDLQLGERRYDDIPALFASEDGNTCHRLRRLFYKAEAGDPATLEIRVPAGVRLQALSIRLVCQVATSWLPTLTPGRNRVLLECETDASQAPAVRARFRFDPGLPLPDIRMLEAVSPRDGDALASIARLEWTTGDDTPPACGFQFAVAHDPEMRRVVASNLRRTVDACQWILSDADRSLLQAGSTYYWRVRRIGPHEQPQSDWSRTFSFRVET